MPTYSHSRLETFENCHLKYKLRYIDRIKHDTRGVEALVGGLVHEVLEKLYNDLRLCKKNSLKDLIKFYEERWSEDFDDSVLIVRKDYTPQNYFDSGKQCIERYCARYAPFDQAITLATELNVKFPADEDGSYEMTGYIDRLDQRQDRTYEIHDYKTSRTLPDESKLTSSRQLGFYNLGVSKKYADAKDIEIVFHYLAFDKEYRVRQSEEERERIMNEALDLIRVIESTTEFEPKESSLCEWCEYQELCPKRKHFVIVKALPKNEYFGEAGVSLVDKLDELDTKKKALIKTLDEEIEKVKDALVAYAEKEGVEVVRGTSKKARVTAEERIEFPGAASEERSELEQLVISSGRLDEVSKVDIGALKKVVRSGDWPEDLVKKVMEFADVEMKGYVKLSKLKEHERIEDE